MRRTLKFLAVGMMVAVVGCGDNTPVGLDGPLKIRIAAATVWAQVQALNFIERAQAIADQIAAADAHVVGLQEVSLFWRHNVSSNPP